MSTRTTLVLAAAMSASALTASAIARPMMLSEWTFETSVPITAGPHAAEGGINAATSFAIGFHTATAAVYSNPVGNGSTESFSSNFWAIGDYYQFSTSTLGYQDITINWDQTRSGTGPATWDLLWSTDGTNFNVLTDNYNLPATTWSGTIPDATGASSFFAAGPAALDNQGTIYFRVMADSAAGGTAGTARIDNIVINGNEIPAPGALALLGLAGVAAGSRRRR